MIDYTMVIVCFDISIINEKSLTEMFKLKDTNNARNGIPKSKKGVQEKDETQT